MIVETKFNLGDVVWIIHLREARKITVRMIEVTAWKDSIMILYVDDNMNRYHEEDLFKTRKEADASIIE